jgi:uncharacterized protein YjiS (DUF1127 family)
MMLQSVGFEGSAPSWRSSQTAETEPSRHVPTVLRRAFGWWTRAGQRARAQGETAGLSAHLCKDIGLEPFDIYYGWRGPNR